MRDSSRWHWIFWIMPAVSTIVLILIYSTVRPFPLDDHFFYQAFVESLARGHLDLTIPGFHGSDVFAVPVYWLTRSPIAQIYFQILCALLLPFLATMAGFAFTRSKREALFFCGIIVMMPFTSFVALRGWTGPAYFSLMFLSIALAPAWPLLAGITLAFAILTKPFAVALIPLLMVLILRDRAHPRRALLHFLLPAFLLPALYFMAQWLVAGKIFLGAHPSMSFPALWPELQRIVLNAAHSFQMLFSVHNYYFPDPALTGPANMLHTTPLLMFLGLFGILHPAPYFQDRRMPFALLLGALIGIGLNLPLDHMDHYYMEAGVLVLILAALPVLRRHLLWVPLVLATLHFQWLYFYLQFRDPFHLTPVFFLAPLTVDVFFLVWCLAHVRTVLRLLQPIIAGHPLGHWLIGPAHSTRVQLFRYLFVGGSSAVVDFTVYVVCVMLGVHYLVAKLISYCFGFTWNYLTSILWVFQSSRDFRKEISIVFAISLIGLLWTELLLYCFVDLLSMGAIIANIFATALVLFWNFGARKIWAFR